LSKLQRRCLLHISSLNFKGPLHNQYLLSMLTYSTDNNICCKMVLLTVLKLIQTGLTTFNKRIILSISIAYMTGILSILSVLSILSILSILPILSIMSILHQAA